MNHKVQGVWQLGEDQPDIPGTLYVDDTGIRLELVKPGAALGPFDDPARYPVIWGRTEHLPGGHHVTLFDCFRSSATNHSSLLTTETIVANQAFVGDAYVSSPREQLFDSFTLSWDGLYAWLGRSGKHQPDRGDDVVAAAAYRLIPPVIAQLGSAELQLGVTVSSSHGMGQSEMNESAFVRGRLTDPCTFADLRAQLTSPLMAFFHLAMARPCAVTSLEVGITDETRPLGESRFKVLTQWKHKGQGERGNPYEMLFTHSQIEPQLEDLLKGWFQLYGSAGRAVDLILAPSDLENLPIDCALAYTLRGLQDLAGRGLLVGAPSLDEAVAGARSDAAKIAQAFEAGLRSVIAGVSIAPYSGTWERPAFWAQLLAFLVQHESLVRAISEGPRELWSQLVDVDDRLWGFKPRSFDDLVDLFWLGQRATIVGRAAVLRALGFSMEEVGKMLARDPVFYQLGRKR